MSSQVDVSSIEAIDTFRAQFVAFNERCMSILEEVEQIVRRAQDWLDHDRPAYHKTATRRAEDDLHRARLNFAHCTMFHVGGEEPSCLEERAKVRLVIQRRDDVVELGRRIRHWQHEMEHQQHELAAPLAALRRALEADVPQAIGNLRRFVRTLDKYRATKTSPAGASLGPDNAKL